MAPTVPTPVPPLPPRSGAAMVPGGPDPAAGGAARLGDERRDVRAGRLDRINPSGPADPTDPTDRGARDAHLAALLAGAARGRGTDFEAFYDATVGYARALARRILHGADLEDGLADAYLDAWRRVAQYDPARGSPVSWLLTIVHSRALDLRRRGGAHEVIEADAERADDAPDPAERLWQRQAGQQLAAALATLSAQERCVLGLAYFRDASHRAIAAATGLPLGTVKSLILRAQAKLRQRMVAAP